MVRVTGIVVVTHVRSAEWVAGFGEGVVGVALFVHLWRVVVVMFVNLVSLVIASLVVVFESREVAGWSEGVAGSVVVGVGRACGVAGVVVVEGERGCEGASERMVDWMVGGGTG